MRRLSFVVALLLLGSHPSLAQPAPSPPSPSVPTAAPSKATCTDGKIATSDGHCCWPGQIWSATYARCLGAPQCPVGLVAQAASCVPPETVPSPAPAPARTAPPAYSPAQSPPSQYPTTYSPSYAPASTYYSPPAPREPERYTGGPVPAGAHVERRRNRSLLRSGIAVFASFYALAIGAGVYGSIEAAGDGVVYDWDTKNTHVAAQIAYNWIPLVGPLVAGARFESAQNQVVWSTASDGVIERTQDNGVSPSLVWGLEAMDFIGQAAGVGLICAGMFTHRKWLVFANRGETSVALVPSGAGALMLGRF